MGQSLCVGGVHHVGLSVSDLAASQSFFTDELGFEVVREVPEYPAAILTNTKAMITLWQVNDPGTCTPFNRRENVGLHHLALEVDSPTALDALHDRFVENGVTIEFAPEPRSDGNAVHMMTLIPGGPRVEFVCPI